MGQHSVEGRIDPRAHLDEINELRVRVRTQEVVDLADRIRRSWEGSDESPLGLGAVCQVAFVALMDVGRVAEAQVWRARAMIEGSQAGEPNTVAMLAVPLALTTRDYVDEPALSATDAALQIMAEIGRAADRLQRGEWSGPGNSLSVLWRAYYEKSGYVAWRAGRYDDALSWYQQARPHVRSDTRDNLRLDAGEVLCRLGQDQAAGILDTVEAGRTFERFHRSADGRWDDIAEVFEANVARLARGIEDVQDLVPVEVERRSPGGLLASRPRGEQIGRNEVLNTILRRRSFREAYEDRTVPDDELRDVLRAGCAAPSSKNAQPWRFHVVEDRAVLTAIADAAASAEGADSYVPRDPQTGQPRPDWPSTVGESAEVLRNAPIGIFVENKGSFSDGRATLAAASAASADGLVGSLVGYTFEVLGLGAAIENMVLAAQSLGIQTAFMGDLVIAESFVRRALSMSGDFVGVLMLGYSSEVVPPRGHLVDIDDDSRVVWHR